MKALKAALLIAVFAAGVGAGPSAGLSSFSRAVSTLNGYNTSINLFEAKGSSTWLATFSYSYSKPNSVNVHIDKGNNAGKDVSWGGGSSVRAGRGMFSKNVALTDPLVTSLRGYTVVDLSFPSILHHAENTEGKMSESTGELSGKPAQLLILSVANPAGDDGMTREILYLDPFSHLPLRIDGFIGSTLVRSYTFSATTTR